MVKSALMEAWEAGCAACEQGVDFSGNPHNPPGALDDDSGIEFDAWLAGWADVKKQMAEKEHALQAKITALMFGGKAE